MYFTRFNPIFPIVHAPTFRPSTRRSLLLLSICSIGSLFLASPSATAQGTKLFERLNKTILASVRAALAAMASTIEAEWSQWESYLIRGGGEALAMTQAALIGQTFGMLSGVFSSSSLLTGHWMTLLILDAESKASSNRTDLPRYRHCGKQTVKSRTRINSSDLKCSGLGDIKCSNRNRHQLTSIA